MRRTRNFLLATVIAAVPMPVAAQVTVDLNALNGLGAAALPTPPPSAPRTLQPYHRRRHLAARAAPASTEPAKTAIASTGQGAPGPGTIEHPGNLGPSFTSLPALPGTAPPAPPPPPVLPAATPPRATAAKPPAQPAPPKLAETAATAPKPRAPVPKPAAAAPAAPALALPGAAPPPPPAPTPAAPTRLAEATPAPPAAAPTKPAPNALPAGADRLTLPFFVQESDLPPAEDAMLRDFAQRYGAGAHYVIRAFASSPAGDDDPSTPRRIALERAQSVAAALMDSGVQADRVRLLALGDAGGTPADRVEVIAMPPSSGHTNTDSSP